MIGRWISLPRSSICCTPLDLDLDLEVKTNFVGYIPREFLMFRSYYDALVSHCICRNKVPMRVTFFFWPAALGKIFTIDNLRKQHVIVIDWCCMC